MKASIPCLLLLGLSGCAAPAPAPVAQAALARTCISMAEVVGQRLAAPSSVLFETAGPVNYRSEVGPQCPGATRLAPATAVVSIASSAGGGQLCAGDRVRIFDPVEASGFALDNLPTCALSEFSPVTR